MPGTHPFVVLLIQLAVAFLAGVSVAFQPGVNAKFADVAGHRVHGGVVSFAVGLLAMLVFWVGSRAEIPPAARLAQGPWWMWTGGVMGAFFVLAAVFLAPRMGAASYLAAAVAGQLIASLIIDHFGWMGLATVPITPGKVAGVLLIIGGMACVRFL